MHVCVSGQQRQLKEHQSHALFPIGRHFKNIDRSEPSGWVSKVRSTWRTPGTAVRFAQPLAAATTKASAQSFHSSDSRKIKTGRH